MGALRCTPNAATAKTDFFFTIPERATNKWHQELAHIRGTSAKGLPSTSMMIVQTLLALCVMLPAATGECDDPETAQKAVEILSPQQLDYGDACQSAEFNPQNSAAIAPSSISYCLIHTYSLVSTIWKLNKVTPLMRTNRANTYSCSRYRW
jgi:hypothetical protein